MKQLSSLFTIIAAVGGSIALHAQPVITSSAVLPSVGTVDSVYTASATVAPGSGGAGITWNLSTLSLTYGGTVTVINVSASPYAATFPSANFCLQISAGPTSYNYSDMSASGLNTVATSYAGVGTGQDYTPDNRLEAPFPFHYTDSVNDTYQMVGSSAETEGVIYDGYGSLVMPLYTYSNVIRIKKNYGSDYHYQWYTVNPFYLVLDYSSSGNNYVYIAEQPSAATGIAQITTAADVSVTPNPISTTGTLNIRTSSGIQNAFMTITDMAGRVVKQIMVTNSNTVISRDGMANGLYFYEVYNNGNRIAIGKMLIQ